MLGAHSLEDVTDLFSRSIDELSFPVCTECVDEADPVILMSSKKFVAAVTRTIGKIKRYEDAVKDPYCLCVAAAVKKPANFKLFEKRSLAPYCGTSSATKPLQSQAMS